MRSSLLSLAVTALIAALVVSARGQPNDRAADKAVLRTPWGSRDLQGHWQPFARG